MNASKRKLALIDIYEAAEYIARDNVEAAIRFIDAVEMSITRITEVPKIGALQNLPRRPDLRMWYVKGFPKVLIFYEALPNEIEIFRVLHSARDVYRILDEEID